MVGPDIGNFSPNRSTDGKRARLPFRWLQWETGKTTAFPIPSRPANTRTHHTHNVAVAVKFRIKRQGMLNKVRQCLLNVWKTKSKQWES
jgi:hypothetical protein